MKKTEIKTKQAITIDGKEYPCFRTVAANFDFKDATGKEVTRIDYESVTELVTYMWCCIKGACYRSGIKFPYETAKEMSYWITEEDIAEWSRMMNPETGEEAKKK